MSDMLQKITESAVGKFFVNHLLVPYWARRTPTRAAEGGSPPALQPSDNMQRMMNLVMPLKDKSPVGRAKAVKALSEHRGQIYAGLDNVGTVHFARFVIVDNNLCMISVYDGDFSNYIRDFIGTIGTVFDAVVSLVEDGDAVVPTEKNVEAFIEWVHARDLFQVPDLASDIMVEWNRNNLGVDQTPDDDLTLIPRQLVLQLRANPNISLGSGYRRYPGAAASQIRNALGSGW